jgi:transposase InsO family protein
MPTKVYTHDERSKIRKSIRNQAERTYRNGPILWTSQNEAGYRNILVITDYVTKYVVAVPLFSKTAEEVAQEFVDKWCLTYGWPKRIQTNQGGEFTGNVLQAITEAARVKRSTTTLYHPQANGQVERTNKTIAQMLSKRCYTNQRTWSKILTKIIYEYNCSKHRVTG